MQLQQKFLILLATTLLAAQPIQSGFAFEIKGKRQSSSVTTQLKSIENNTIDGTSTVTTKSVLEIKPGSGIQQQFINILENSFEEFEFRNGGNLKGDFNIINYYPCGPLIPCGSELSSIPGIDYNSPSLEELME